MHPANHLVLFLAVLFGPLVRAQDPEAPAEAPTIVETMMGEAVALKPFLVSKLARRFVARASVLPLSTPRTMLQDREAGRFLTPAEVAPLDEEARRRLHEVTVDPARYYVTKYGTPLAYSRVVDVLAAYGLDSLENKKVVDFGYGSIGHLRLLALAGAHAVGVDVDPYLAALYSEPADQGPLPTPDGPRGRVTLVHGTWPSDPATAAAVGGGIDVFTSKNTLKRGYVHPERPAPERQLVRLGLPDDAWLSALHAAMNAGALAVIYNLAPAPSAPDEPYEPWSDGRCPFTREALVDAGFEVLAYDVNDDARAREMGERLGWSESMDLEKDLFGTFTVFRKRGGE